MIKMVKKTYIFWQFITLVILGGIFAFVFIKSSSLVLADACENLWNCDDWQNCGSYQCCLSRSKKYFSVRGSGFRMCSGNSCNLEGTTFQDGSNPCIPCDGTLVYPGSTATIGSKYISPASPCISVGVKNTGLNSQFNQVSDTIKAKAYFKEGGTTLTYMVDWAAPGETAYFTLSRWDDAFHYVTVSVLNDLDLWGQGPVGAVACANFVQSTSSLCQGQSAPQPTPTPPPSCNLSCGRTKSCSGGLTCYANPAWKWWFNQGSCRNSSCLTDTDCVCPQPTPTSTPTIPPSTPTPTPTTGPTRTPTPTRAPCPYNCVSVYCPDVAIGYSCPPGQTCCRPTPIPTPVGYHRFCPI